MKIEYFQLIRTRDFPEIQSIKFSDCLAFRVFKTVPGCCAYSHSVKKKNNFIYLKGRSVYLSYMILSNPLVTDYKQ